MFSCRGGGEWVKKRKGLMEGEREWGRRRGRGGMERVGEFMERGGMVGKKRR